MTAKEVGELLGVSSRWVLDQARRNRLPHVPLGRNRRFRRESIMEWIVEQERR